MRECKEGQDSCITDYLHYIDAPKSGAKPTVFCEIGRDCCKYNDIPLFIPPKNSDFREIGYESGTFDPIE